MPTNCRCVARYAPTDNIVIYSNFLLKSQIFSEILLPFFAVFILQNHNILIFSKIKFSKNS